MVMYDSLNRLFLPGYSGEDLNLPNFLRLAEHSLVFDCSYVGSLPCMPARRELHTGRYNFLHRSWGPLEPFDDSMPEILKRNGIQTHLTTDHYHYFEDGGATYHNRYNSYTSHRGQESDAWCGLVQKPVPSQMMSLDQLPDGFRQYRTKTGAQNMANRSRITREEDFPQYKTFSDGLDFIDLNHEQDNWFLSIETFDPHEPFHSPDEIQRRFFDPDQPLPPEDWPPYAQVTEKSVDVENMRKKYRALLTMCDQQLGRLLDKMDQYGLWQDTMLIVNTDHGFLLSEHGWWGKSVMPVYDEIAHTPLYIWDPRYGRKGEHRRSLVQTIDLAPTLLDFFKVNTPADMQGKSLTSVISNDEPVREYALFGYFGDTINITDGNYVYHRAPVSPDAPLFEYTLMPTHMNSRFSPAEMQQAKLVDGWKYTKLSPVLMIPVQEKRQMQRAYRQGNLLYNLNEDPKQNQPLLDDAREAILLTAMRQLMLASDAPAEQFARVGLEK